MTAGQHAGEEAGDHAYDAHTGEELWVSRYDHAGAGLRDYGGSILVSPNGNAVIVTGIIEDTVTYRDYGTIAYDVLDGHQLWFLRRYLRGDLKAGRR